MKPILACAVALLPAACGPAGSSHQLPGETVHFVSEGPRKAPLQRPAGASIPSKLPRDGAVWFPAGRALQAGVIAAAHRRAASR